MNPTIRAALRKIINRQDDTNKYDYGHVLVVGGSPGFVGAPLLAAMGALRVGAGLVTIASQADVIDKLEERVTDVMTWRIPADKPLEALQTFVAERHVKALVVGPGTSAAHGAILREIVSSSSTPTVVDAGAIAAFQDSLPMLAQVKHPLILTPHTGEFKKLIGVDAPNGRKAQEAAAVNLAKSLGIHLVLKGAHTLVTHPDATTYHNTTGNPGLAAAGTGDVLSGIVAGLLAQGITPTEASETGVYLHGLAGDLAASELTEPGMVASDLERFIPTALKVASTENL
jgi:hydroxyethylthiazole kinase-like uncharacterized protein yjeF